MHCTQGNFLNHVYTVLDVFQGADSTESIPYGYLPTAHTCSNVSVLPIGFLTAPLPEEQGLFQVMILPLQMLILEQCNITLYVNKQ